MDISVNTNNAALGAVSLQALQGTVTTPRADPPLLMGSTPVTVTDAPADLEKLTALLTQDSNRARLNSLISTLKSAYDVIAGMNEALAKANETTLRKIDEKASEIDAKDKEIKGAEAEEKSARRALSETEGKISDTKKAIDGNNEKLADEKVKLNDRENEAKKAQDAFDKADSALNTERSTLESIKAEGKREGESDLEYSARVSSQELVVRDAETKANKANNTLREKNAAVTETQNSITALDNSIAADSAKLTGLEAERQTRSAILNDKTANVTRLKDERAQLDTELDLLAESLDDTAYQALMDAARANLDDFDGFKPIDEGSDDDAVARTPPNKRSPIDIIRDSLRRQAGDMNDAIEMNRNTLI